MSIFSESFKLIFSLPQIFNFLILILLNLTNPSQYLPSGYKNSTISPRPMDFNNENVSIYSCEFQAFVERAKVQIKFPCNYFLQWKANNGKVIVSSPNRFQANKSEILFNQTLKINVNMLYDKISNQYLKKESLLMINLISKSRPDQVKLVGRVAVDLADVLNSKSFENITTLQLEYCSVEASMNFFVKSVSVKQSSMHVSQLDRSSFNEYMSFQSNLKPHQGFIPRNEGSSTHRDFDDDRSAKGSDKGEIRSLGRDKNKMSSPTLMKTVYTPSSRQMVRMQGSIQQQSKISRSNSVTNQLQNPNKMFPPPLNKVADPPLVTESESNFSFNNSKAQQRNKSQISKSKMTTSQFLSNEESQKSGVSSKVRNSEPVLPKQLVPMVESNQKPRDLRISLDKVETTFNQNMPKSQRVSTVLSPKQSQQDLMKKIQKDGQIISERQAVIRKLQSQVQLKRHTMPLEASFTSSIKQPNAKKLSVELSKTNSESKRIIGLTQALNQLQTKYTTLTLETQEMRSAWKRERQQLLSAVSIAQGAISAKDKQIREKAKVNEMLQYSLQESEKLANERLAEVIYVKSQLSQAQKHSNLLGEDKVKLQGNLRRLEEQILMIKSQTSSSQDQLNRTFGDRLAIYQDKITEVQNKLNLSEKEKKNLLDRVSVLEKENNKLLQKIRGLQEENKTYLGQIEQAHNELFGLKEENQVLKKEILRKEKENREQKERIWSSKDEQVSHQLSIKNDEIDRIREQLSMKIKKIQEESRVQLQRASQHYHSQSTQQKQQISTLLTKIQQLQNTILTLNDQVTTYQQKIGHLTQQLSLKSIKLQQISCSHKNINEQKKTIQQQHQQLILALNSQIQEHMNKITSIEKEMNELRELLGLKDLQLLKTLEGTQQHKHELELTKAQATIFESKLLQQRQYYQQQAQSLRLQCSQHIYQTQIQLQQQLQKYQQLQHIKQMLKQSLQQWQNKCTDDRIASSKVVSRLNDIIKQKQQTMYEMENIMRHLEKDKIAMQEHLVQQTANYHQVLNLYQVKHQQLKLSVHKQETQCIALYEAVKLQRQQIKNNLIENQQTIKRLQNTIDANNTTITELNTQISTLKQSLHNSESLLIQSNSLLQTKISSLKNQHNQQADQYEERIRQLQQKILQKDNELLDREMALVEQEKYITQFKLQLQGKNQEINELVRKQAELHEQINLLKGEIDTMNNQKQRIVQEKQTLVNQIQSLKLNLQESSCKYTQLQNTLLQYQQKQKQTITKINEEKQQLSNQLSSFSDLQQKHLETIKNLQDEFIMEIQKLKDQHSVAIRQALNQQQVKQQEISSKITVLEQQKLKLNQLLLEKTTELQVINEQKSIVEQQMTTLKGQRQTQVLLSYKEQIDKYKLQVKSLNEELLQARNQLKQIPTLQRAIKIKTIELNSLKYKSSSINSHTSDSQQLNNLEQIIKLKDQQINALKKDNESMKHHELQLYQLQSLKEQLYQSIEQYQEEKFHLSSQLNEKEIKIAELKQELMAISNSKTELKDKVHQLSQKIHYYQTLILDFKGHNEMSSTKSHSDKLNTSRISSGKLIQIQAENSPTLQTKLQLDTFIKKIKLLQTDILKHKDKEQQMALKEENYLTQLKNLQTKINELQQVIKDKDIEINKKTTAKQPIQSVKTQVTYKNPQQVASTFKQIQTLLKKRSEFHNLESTLLKVHQINLKQSIQSQKQDHETKEKLLTTGAHISLLSKEFQNLKAKIMKLQGKNYQEKAKFISLLRPCEDSIKEVSKLYESTDSSKHSSFQNI